MRKLLFVSAFFTIMVLFSSCGTQPNREVYGIINTLRIETGQPDTVLVSDLFYAPDYDINFVENQFIKTTFDQASGKLILDADTSFTGITLLKFTS